MEVDEIIAELSNYNGTFPREALVSAIAKRDEIIAELLMILERDTENIEALVGQDEYMAHIYAMFLLAQFREIRAYPIIYKFFSVPGEISSDATGDLVTEFLPQILASVSCGDISLIMQLAENRTANKFVRMSALSSLLVLVNSGELIRENVVEYYRNLFRTRSSNEDPLFLTHLVVCLKDLYPEEAYAEIKQAYNDNLIYEDVIDLPDIDKVMAKGKENVLMKLKNSRDQLITNTITEMEWWDCFQPQKWSEYIPEKSDKTSSSLLFANPIRPVTTYVREERKIGRNDPCPCGSGKKYKKCCGLNP